MATDFYSLQSFVTAATRGCVASYTERCKPVLTSATQVNMGSYEGIVKIQLDDFRVIERSVYYYDRHWHNMSEASKLSPFLNERRQSSITLEGLLKLYIYPMLEETIVPIDAVV